MNRNLSERFNIQDTPMYTISEAAHYLKLPKETLRSWVKGRKYPTVKEGQKQFHPLINLNESTSMLTFTNLVEAHVLSSLRRQHKIRMDKVREAIDVLEHRFNTLHPLASQDMETDGINILIEKYGELINLNNLRQGVLKEIVKAYVKRISRSSEGLPLRLYPFVRTHQAFDPSDPKLIVIDPLVSFGRPTITGTGVATSIIAERYRAGDTIADIVADYRIPEETIHEAIRCELATAA